MWDKLQAGEIANIDEYEGKDGRLPAADPRNPENWENGRRRLTKRFLESLLLREPYGSKLHRQGVRIEGAWFDDEIELEGAEVTLHILLERCRFQQPVRLAGLRTPHIVSFGGSAFAADLRLNFAKVGALINLAGAKIASSLNMNEAEIGRSLFMCSVSEQRAEFNDVVLRGAKVGGQVVLIGAKVAGKIEMASTDIGQDLFMHSDRRVSEHRAEFNDVVLRGAKVGGQIDLTGAKVGKDVSVIGAKVAGMLNMDSAYIGQSLVMRSGSEQDAEFSEVVLRGAEVGGQVDLTGAKIAGKVNMNEAEIGRSLFMRSVSEQRAEFNEVAMIGAKVGRQVDLTGAKIAGKLDMDFAEIGQNLHIYSSRTYTSRTVSEHQAELAEVVLNGAKVGGTVYLMGAKVAGKLSMDSAEIGQSLFMNSDREVSEHQAEFFAEVVLNGAKVGGQVTLAGAKVAGKLEMASVEIGQHLFMHSDRSVSDHRAEFNDVVLRGAKVGGQVALNGAKVAGKLEMDSADIGQHLLMGSDRSVSEQCAELDGGANLIFARIGSGLNLRGAVLPDLDLTGTEIGGELALASASSSSRWKEGGRLVLRNASVDAIQDTAAKGVWPRDLELDGFTYRRFGGFGASTETDIAKRGSGWFIDWLAKDEPYTPGPYQQCARVLREMGHPEMANDVLYAGRERERKQALRRGNNPRGTGLTLLKWFVGYGYGQRLLWRPLGWVFVLVAAGTVVLHLTGVPRELAGSEANVVAYSFDTLLPIVQLEKSHADIMLDGFAKYYFYFQKLMGWMLASFLIAGLSGLTK